MIYVRQRFARDCGIAVLAMVTGHSWETVASFFGDAKWDESGIYLQDIDDYLADFGWGICRKKMVSCRRDSSGNRTYRSPWPPAPFATSHICEVRVAKDSPCLHFVVWALDGDEFRIFDPMTDERRQLSDYYQVLNVAGVIQFDMLHN